MPAGIDASWFNSLQSKSQEDVEQTIALAKGMEALNLPEEAQKYYRKIMREALKDVPIDQWDKALKELNKLLIFDDEGNILRVLPVNMGAGDGVIILKNGVNDQELTQQANKEFSAQQLELLKQLLGQLATGLATALTVLGITGLDFAGTYFSGGTLALVGVTQAGAVAGTATAGVGVATVADAVSQMGVQAGDINYSFANGYDSQIRNTYDGIKNSPNYPEGFETRQNGTTNNKIKDKDLLQELRKVESGDWKKIYKDGFDKDGNKMSIHYFQSKSGKVFDVKVKPGWSNP